MLMSLQRWSRLDDVLSQTGDLSGKALARFATSPPTSLLFEITVQGTTLIIFDVTVSIFATTYTLCTFDFQLPRSQPVFARLAPNLF